MKQRSIGKMFLLTIVTLGIYRLYWFAKTRQEMLSLKKELKIPPVIWLVAPVLFVVAAVVLFFTSGAATHESSDTSLTGIQIASLVLFYIAILAVPLLMAIWLWKYSKAVEVVTNEKMNFAISLLILLAVPDGIDILIVQDAFNKIAVPQNASSASTAWEKP